MQGECDETDPNVVIVVIDQVFAYLAECKQ